MNAREMDLASTADDDLVRRQGEHVFYTWTAQDKAAPVEIVGGEGARFQTADGSWWWDLGSVTWNANLGHGHPHMQKVLARAAERGLLAMPAAAFPDKAEAGRRLLQVVPPGLSAGKVFFCLSGAEANENAVKMARLVTGRAKVITRSRSYHGATLAMLSLSGDPRSAPFEPGYPGRVRWDDPYRAEPCPGDLEEVLRREGPETVAAVLLEGVVGANGVLVPPPGYYHRIREICDRYGVLWIDDEVLSGFGRTGRWFAVDHDGVSPDLLTGAKGLTGGYAPGGVVVASARVAHHFDQQPLLCGLTAYAHPLVCAAVLGALDVYQEERLPERAAALGDLLSLRLEFLARTRPYLGGVRGLGLLWALELVDPIKRQPASPTAMAQVAETLRCKALHMHKRDNLLYLAPPLVISEEALDEALGQLMDALDEAFSP